MGIIGEAEALYTSSVSLDYLRGKISELIFKIDCLVEAHHEDQFELIKKIADLEAKFDAINKHYGVTVEHEDAKYTVKEIK